MFSSIARSDATVTSDLNCLISLEEDQKLIDWLVFGTGLEDLPGRKVNVIQLQNL
ncbi:MAG: hypothetical protein AAFV90_00515 [Cyanobacteria bacterium J06634_5]